MVPPRKLHVEQSAKSLFGKAEALVANLGSDRAKAAAIGASPSSYSRWKKQMGTPEGPIIDENGLATIRAFLVLHGALDGELLTFAEGVQRGKMLAIEAIERRILGAFASARAELNLPATSPPGSPGARELDPMPTGLDFPPAEVALPQRVKAAEAASDPKGQKAKGA